MREKKEGMWKKKGEMGEKKVARRWEKRWGKENGRDGNGYKEGTYWKFLSKKEEKEMERKWTTKVTILMDW